MSSHLSYMHHALRLARRNLGQTWPNPSVGAVIVNSGQVVGTGATARGGRPHAETQTLAMAGSQAAGAKLYVTLEPCAHEGKTPPCTDAIIAAGIRHVVIACPDPAPHVNGLGVAQLRDAGLEVTENILRDEAEALNEGSFSVVKHGRPFVTLKLATSLDGKVATRNGHSQWITDEAARNAVHLMRAQHDAIMTGIGTVLADNPQLTCRLPGLEDRSPVRIVTDSHLKIPLESALVSNARVVPLWVATKEENLSDLNDKIKQLEAAGVEVIAVPEGMHGRLDLSQLLQLLGERGITRLMVEAGSMLPSVFIKQGLVDRLCWFRGAMIIGADGLPSITALEHDTLESCPRFVRSNSPYANMEAYTCLLE